MSWAHSLIKLSAYEVEVLQKRMAEIAERLQAAEVAVALLDAEAEMETLRALNDAEAGWYLLGFKEGMRQRRSRALALIDEIQAEADGARDALNEAFGAQKKYETIADQMAAAARKLAAQREAQAFDEIALRRARA